MVRGHLRWSVASAACSCSCGQHSWLQTAGWRDLLIRMHITHNAFIRLTRGEAAPDYFSSTWLQRSARVWSEPACCLLVLWHCKATVDLEFNCKGIQPGETFVKLLVQQREQQRGTVPSLVTAVAASVPEHAYALQYQVQHIVASKLKHSAGVESWRVLPRRFPAVSVHKASSATLDLPLSAKRLKSREISRTQARCVWSPLCCW